MFCKVKKTIVSVLLAFLIVAVMFCGALTQAAGAADYKSWMQSDPGWRNLQLGTSGETCVESGCAVTAAAILMVHSGSVTDSSFTPATIINYLNKNGGFNSSAILDWTKLKGYAPSFLYQGSETISGTEQQKAARISQLLDEGYYVIASVRNGEHFVAIDSVSGSNVTMMDPATSSTSLFKAYLPSGVNSLRKFKGKNSVSSVQTMPNPPFPGIANPTMPAMTNPPAPTMTNPPAPAMTNPPAPTMTNPTLPTETIAPPPAPTEDPTEPIENPPAPTEPTEPLPVPEIPIEEELPNPPMPVQGAPLPGIAEDDMIHIGLLIRTTRTLNFRESPDVDAPVLYVIPEGTILEITAVDMDYTWGKAFFADTEGWISLDYITLHTKS